MRALKYRVNAFSGVLAEYMRLVTFLAMTKETDLHYMNDHSPTGKRIPIHSIHQCL
jgi:hypothetical protein